MSESGSNRRREAERAARAGGRARAYAAALAVLLAGGTAPAALRAQVVNFHHYTSAEGLPQAQVMAIRQDRMGYIWFASYGGISRFNGAEFLTYTKEDGLSSNSVFDVTEDSGGRLLLATSAGVCVMEQGKFQCYRQSDGLIYDNTRSVAADVSGGVWVGTARGVSYMLNGRFRNYTVADGLPSESVVRVAVDSAGRVWAATNRGLARLRGDRFEADPARVIGSSPIQFIVPTSRGLLVGTEGRLYLRRTDEVIPIGEGQIAEGTTLVDGAVDRDGTIWVGTRTGALRIRNGRVDRLDQTRGLLTDLINRVVIDAEGDVWFGTESGASKHVPGPFSTFTMEEGLPSSFVRALELDARGRLWAGTRNGVAVREGGVFRTVDLNLEPDTRVFSLARAPGGGMLVGTRRGLVWEKDGQVRMYLQRDGLPGEVIYSLLPDGDRVWIGTDHGLAVWEAGRITAYANDEIARMNLIALGMDEQGRLWLGRSTGGVVVLDGDSLLRYGPENGGTDQTVWAIEKDAQGRMWAATNGDGVLRFEPAGIRRFTTRDGLASNFIWQVLADSRGDIWLYGNSGLDRFSSEAITHYGRGAGLIELEGSANAAHEDAEGNLWFGTGSGVVRYVPGLDVAPAVDPPIYVEAVSHNDSPVAWAGQTEPVRLPLGVVRIRFAAPSFRDESALRYRYRLVGVTGSVWSEPAAERSITYAGLAPGQYRFEVLATSRGKDSAAPATFSFTITPAFWQTWWFRTGVVLVLLAVTALVPIIRANRLELERRRLEALVAQHTRELAEKNEKLEQSNRDLEHFAYVASHDLQEPLRKIQAFSDRVTRQYTDRLDDQGRDYLGRMGSAAARMQRLIDDLLSLSRVSTRRNEPERINLHALLKEVLGDLEFRLQSTGGRVEVGELPAIYGDPVQIRQVFQNLIGNALKFHRPGVSPIVSVNGRLRDPNTVEIHVEDNGIGFEKRDAERVFLPFQRLHSRADYEGTGIGLTICQKIISRHGGAIRANSVPGQGTEFLITLPVHGLAGEKNAA